MKSAEVRFYLHSHSPELDHCCISMEKSERIVVACFRIGNSLSDTMCYQVSYKLNCFASENVSRKSLAFSTRPMPSRALRKSSLPRTDDTPAEKLATVVRFSEIG